jgi:hypothetical protein
MMRSKEYASINIFFSHENFLLEWVTLFIKVMIEPLPSSPEMVMGAITGLTFLSL